MQFLTKKAEPSKLLLNEKVEELDNGVLSEHNEMHMEELMQSDSLILV